ncbi:MAG: ATP-dependent DNA helicase [Clostridiales bacterium]|nr:ATP-dependent DNA helicase [Clostridiales bacterium]
MKGKNKELYASCDSINKYFIDIRKRLGDSKNCSGHEEEKDLYHLLMSFTTKAEKHLSMKDNQNTEDELLDAYFNVLNFLKISELYDDRYTTYIEKYGSNVKVKLFCLDPSLLLSQVLKKGKMGVFFSATLLPKDYFLEILGGDENSKFLCLNSPFNKDNRSILVADNVQTRYSKRDSSYDQIADYINSTVLQKSGNYIVYFPSYKYMNEVYSRFIEEYPDYNVNVQSPKMTESEKSEFIDFFEPDPKNHNIGFCVLGGVYSEGIDLTDDRLIGVIIVGVGLPQICFERDIIREYYDKKNNRGFQYSYMYPGMNKVMQAAGRLIRSETDRGIILLLDERFSHYNYQKLFPAEWLPHKKVHEGILTKVLADFWETL